MSNLQEVTDRIARLETRLVRGFNELGIDVTHNSHKPVCVCEGGKLALSSLDVSVAVLFRTALDNGLDIDHDVVTVEYDGRQVLNLNLKR